LNLQIKQKIIISKFGKNLKIENDQKFNKKAQISNSESKLKLKLEELLNEIFYKILCQFQQNYLEMWGFLGFFGNSWMKKWKWKKFEKWKD